MSKVQKIFLGALATICLVGVLWSAPTNYYGPPPSPDQYGNTVLGAIWQASTTTISNIIFGYGAGANVSSGTNNIYIGNAGTAGDFEQIRIGTPGVHTNTYIAGGLQTGSGTNITTIAQGSTGWTNILGVDCLVYIYATNGAITAWAGNIGTNSIEVTGIPTTAGVWTFLLQPGWSITSTNLAGKAVPFP